MNQWNSLGRTGFSKVFHPGDVDFPGNRRFFLRLIDRSVRRTVDAPTHRMLIKELAHHPLIGDVQFGGSDEIKIYGGVLVGQLPKTLPQLSIGAGNKDHKAKFLAKLSGFLEH
jgi:hypothetical protein